MAAKELVESRRTRYTRAAMQDALMDLLAERPLARISVKELCERADVNRSTFYAHYENIDELLRDVEDDAIAWVRGALDDILSQPDPAGIGQVVERICQYIADNSRHLQVLMSPKADLGFQQQLLGLIYSRPEAAAQLAAASGAGSAADPAEAEMRMRFAVSGAIGLLQHWLATDLRAPAATVARIICAMTLFPAGAGTSSTIDIH